MNGFYLIENHVPYSKKQDCLRVIRDGVTWSTLWSDVPHAIELRDNGELWGAMIVQGPDGELRGPLVRLGTWAKTETGLDLTWPRWKEHLVPERQLPEPPLVRPRGRLDDLLGLVIEQRDGHWRGEIELTGKTEVSLASGDDLAFARARRIVETLRAGALDRVRRQFADQVWQQYIDYCHEMREANLSSPEELAGALQIETIKITPTETKLWFPRVLDEHSLVGVLSDDCQTIELGQP